MKRYYYICDDLAVAEQATQTLEELGLDHSQITVMSLDETGVDEHEVLHPMASLLKKDLLASGLKGALLGLVLAGLIVSGSLLAGYWQTSIGAFITLFASVAIFGFCTWEGGLWGIQTNNATVARYEEILRDGKHVVLVDVDDKTGLSFAEALTGIAGLQRDDVSRGLPSWLVTSKRTVPKFFSETLP